MEFGSTIDNPLLQIAIGAGEATIRHACGGNVDMALVAEMEQFPDGRDAVHVRMETAAWSAEFVIVLRNYFERAVLWRVARRAWQGRGEGVQRRVAVLAAAGMN